jgi:hypothetical protein
VAARKRRLTSCTYAIGYPQTVLGETPLQANSNNGTMIRKVSWITGSFHADNTDTLTGISSYEVRISASIVPQG